MGERRDPRIVRGARSWQIDLLLVQDAARPRSHQDDAIGEPHRLPNVVGHEDDRLPGRAPDPLDLALKNLARLGVECGEGFVHEQDGGIGSQGACDGAPLPHSAGQLVGVALAEAPKMHHPQELLAAGRARGSGQFLELERKFHVVPQRQPGKEGRLLKDHRAIRAGCGDVCIAVEDVTSSRPRQSRDEVQDRRFPATRRPEQAQEFARGNLERYMPEDLDRCLPTADRQRRVAQGDLRSGPGDRCRRGGRLGGQRARIDPALREREHVLVIVNQLTRVKDPPRVARPRLAASDASLWGGHRSYTITLWYRASAPDEFS